MFFSTGDINLYVKRELHINDYFGFISVAFWIISITIISYQQKKLNTNSGFRTQEGFHFHFLILIFFLLLMISRLPNELTYKFIKAGTLDQLPQALAIPLGCTSSRVVLSVVTPMLIIAKSKSLRELLKKKWQSLLCHRETRVVPIV